MNKVTTTYVKRAPETEAVLLTEENINEVLAWAQTIEKGCRIDQDGRGSVGSWGYYRSS